MIKSNDSDRCIDAAARVRSPQLETSPTRSTVSAIRRLSRVLLGGLAAVVAASTLILPAAAQTFVAEWNASSSGGVGPTGMVLVTESGTTYLYVADHPRGRILKLNAATGAVVATFGKQGDAAGDFNAPYGIARDPVSGDFYVAERGNHRISRVTSTGTFLMKWGEFGTAQGQFNEPIGVAVDAAGDVYVTDHSNNRVQKFHVTQSGGVWSVSNVAMWGTKGSANGQFNEPYGITADAAGNIWVADGFNGRVQRFNTSGTYLSTLGAAGTAPGQFIVATWLNVAPNGDLLVTSTNSNPQVATLADSNSQWVSRFNSSGTFVSRFGGTYGEGPSQFRLPFGAVVGANDRIYVADYYNSRIQVFDAAAPVTPGNDTTPPTVSTFTVGTTTANTVNFVITFNEAVTGVNAPDFTVVTTGGATATIGAVTGSGTTYTIPVTFTGTTGTIGLNLNASGTGIVDAANNAIAAGMTGPVYTMANSGGTDTTAPTVSTFAIGATTANTINFVITFSESVTGVNAPDFTVVTTGGASGTVGTVTGSGNTYTVPVTFTGTTGTVGLNLNATGTGIADAASNALSGGMTGPVYTVGSAPASGVIASVTTPANGTYGKNQDVTFSLRFNGVVTLVPRAGTPTTARGDDDDDDNEETGAYFTWTAVSVPGQPLETGKVHYVSGSGTNTLTFRYKVHNGDVAPAGIRLGTTLQLDDASVLRDASGATINASALTIPWPQNPLSGVIFNAPKPGNGGGNNNGRGRNDRLVNISSRLRVTGGDASRTVVAGFVVTGNAPKTVLIRAVGPGLAAFGLRDGVSDPRITLRDSTGKLVGENEGWANRGDISSAGDKVGAFKLNPGSKDAAMLVSLAPGAYTAQVTANGNGIVLLEVYDSATGAELTNELIVNISTRGYVGTGDDVLVAGFVVTGSTPKRVLIRGIGPTLTGFGVTGALTDPILKLYRTGGSASPGPLAQNDNWQTPMPIGAGDVIASGTEISAAATSVGAFALPAGSKDASIVVTLLPGNYSAVVSGVNGATGAGLVEVYELP